MTLIELLREARRIDPSASITAFDRRDFDAKPREVKVERVTEITVWKPNGDGSQEGIDVRMQGEQVVEVKPGTTVKWWQADPILRAFRAGENVVSEVPDDSRD